jgi:hypothetical protein
VAGAPPSYAVHYGLGLPEDPQLHAPISTHAEVPQQNISQERSIISKDSSSPPPAPPESAAPPGVFSAPKRASSYAGTWKATDSKGASCVIHLSNVSSLDLYKASVSKCANTALNNVNSWSFTDNRIVLFSKGKMIAHLTGPEASLNGTIDALGTAITMTR